MKAHLEARFTRSVVLFLSGPVIGVAHFVFVYLLAEVSCVPGWLTADVLGMSALSLVTLAVTLVAATVTGLFARAAWRRREGSHGDLAFTGFLLGVLFTIMILFVGVPPVFLGPC